MPPNAGTPSGKRPRISQVEGRVYSVEELRRFQVGASLWHKTLGSCRVFVYKANDNCCEKAMHFTGDGSERPPPDRTALFRKNSYPWDQPMILCGPTTFSLRS